MVKSQTSRVLTLSQQPVIWRSVHRLGIYPYPPQTLTPRSGECPLSCVFPFPSSLPFRSHPTPPPPNRDEGVHHANRVYAGRMHNLFCDNCHSHVCCALNQMGYKNFRSWNMVILAFYVFFWGRFENVGDFLKTFGPFTLLFVVVMLLKG
jgi:hypothetical protein